MSDFLWKIGGEAGFGIMTTALQFSKLAVRCGCYVFAYPEYPSLIRGGHNTFEVLLSDKRKNTSKDRIDFLVCLNKDTYTLHKHRLAKNAVVIFDKSEFEIEQTAELRLIEFPFNQIIKEEKAKEFMKNMLGLSASACILGIDKSVVEDMVRSTFADKGEEVIELNLKFVNYGYNYINQNYSEYKIDLLSSKSSKPLAVLTGNDAFSLACVLSDCRFYSAYPMTPSSSVLSTLAKWQIKADMVVRHSEDEIAVINNALGASFAGIRSAVGTSGGGFALMVESLSFAGVAEIPIVVFLSQRPGPATGMPTWTEQGELMFAVHAGHGEFPKIVLAAGDISEMIEITVKAFNLADKYQTPVIVLSDKFLSESLFSLDSDKILSLIDNSNIDRGKIIRQTNSETYLRYKDSADGISEMLIPGQKGFFYQANSYEHLEDSHTTEDSEPRVQQVNKRARKIQTYLKTDFQLPKVFGNLQESKLVFVSYGANKGPILEASRILAENDMQTAYIHFTHLYPLDEQRLKTEVFDKINKPLVLVENSSRGQLAELLREQAGITIDKKILKYDGRPFYPIEIINKLAEVL
ncbi:MAG: 2-oxoacid:ferredoxin oxidoreductase subunit alpha [Patescibacteria group bacterium]|nr:MAG: 2-oxoacid:ferredoxin oxidoreductase subunit alpha [Patescibacteria group bacterium]